MSFFIIVFFSLAAPGAAGVERSRCRPLERVGVSVSRGAARQAHTVAEGREYGGKNKKKSRREGRQERGVVEAEGFIRRVGPKATNGKEKKGEGKGGIHEKIQESNCQ